MEAPSLRDCLTKRNEALKFAKFAETLLCEENVVFWSRVNQFQALKSEADMILQGQAIWEEVSGKSCVSCVFEHSNHGFIRISFWRHRPYRNSTLEAELAKPFAMI
jgi:hypothetical protein